MKTKIKTHVLMISRVFLKAHNRAGQLTNFKKSINVGVKKHTIRLFFEDWERKIIEVQNGEAILSLREWEGAPYKSKQNTILDLTHLDNVGIEKLEFNNDNPLINSEPITINQLSYNDGLELLDFMEWFKTYDKAKPMAIIHFTGFRYSTNNKKQ